MKGFENMDFGKYIAHRGLHSCGAPENSLKAFENAVNKGVAAELDVRLTKDGRIAVFHDRNLRRMCSVDAELSEFTYEQLSAFTLKDSGEKIPLLSEVLRLVNGRIPLLIEIKNGAPAWTLEKRLYHLLKDYKGAYAVQSFNPFSLLWFRLFAPDVFRGQLISAHKGEKGSRYFARLVFSRPIIWKAVSKPGFIACDLRSVSLESAFAAADIGADFYTWTANTPELIGEALKFSKTVIAENFPPDFDFAHGEQYEVR
ncbi:glycerophosphodiester phosphodiesterase family protein [Ruminococcus sp. Marseille-P6503]|uniref:glycerophosphodiester phosphodiesterase family protein n=1 Tax=Ruminococcus sp. Marseille-P6503 TaxID=2364796 RepID=UPI0013DDDDC1|nr:glycerophosphodiester phosphodiesterase family protein [Ruminococcus sp. Marseille-P6503]